MKNTFTLVLCLLAFQPFAQTEVEFWNSTTSDESKSGYQLFAFLYPNSEHFAEATLKIDSIENLSEKEYPICEAPACLDILLNEQGYALVGFSMKQHDAIMDEYRNMLYEGEKVDITNQLSFETPVKNKMISKALVFIELPVHNERSNELYLGLVNELTEYRDNFCRLLFGKAYIELPQTDQLVFNQWLSRRITLIHQEPFFPVSE